MKKYLLVFVLSLLLVFNLSACITTPTQPPDTLSVYFFDVGQADCILIDLGDTEVLIDGGVTDTGATECIYDYINGPIEAVIVTHFDKDHIGGLSQVFDDYVIEGFWYRGETSGTKTANDLMTKVHDENAEIHTVVRGDIIQVGVLEFSVLNPPVPFFHDDENNNSLVLQLNYGETSFLFMGDAEQKAENTMLSLLTDIDILKVGHHGSDTSSCDNFLKIVNPEIAIIMVGDKKIHGHPSPDTLDRLVAIGATIYKTIDCGTIIITTDGVSTPKVKTAK